MTEVSRRANVRITPEMERAVYKLMIEEDDTKRKKKHPAQWYRSLVAERLKLNDVDNPSLRSYEELNRRIRSNLKEPDKQDLPWSIGSLPLSAIPAEMIPVIIKAQREYFIKDITKKSKIPLRFNIRQAILAAKLYPILAEVIQSLYPSVGSDFMYRILADLIIIYSIEETFQKMVGVKCVDTTFLDDYFFISMKGWDLGKTSYDGGLVVADSLFFEHMRQLEKLANEADGRKKQ